MLEWAPLIMDVDTTVKVLYGKQDLQTKVMVTLFGLFAEIERDLISEHTREGLQSARSKGNSSMPSY
jgi:DNA invertase Pin-like site-specific DNA recombinase